MLRIHNQAEKSERDPYELVDSPEVIAICTNCPYPGDCIEGKSSTSYCEHYRNELKKLREAGQ